MVLYYFVNIIKGFITVYLFFYILLLKSFIGLRIQTTLKASDNSAHGLRIRKNRRKRGETPGQNEHILVIYVRKSDYNKLLGY